MKNSLTRFSFIQILFWCVWAGHGAFNATYGLARGYSQSMVSMALSLYTVCAFFGLLMSGTLSDRLRTNKKLFIAGLAASWVILLLMFTIDSQIAFVITYGIFGVTMGPMSSLLDSWMLKSFGGNVSDYGKARGLGSMGYAVFILIVGQLISRLGYIVMPIASAVTTLATIVLCVITPDAPIEAGAKTSVSFRDISSILGNKLYLSIIIVILFIGLSIAPINNLKIMVLETVGGNVGTQGLDSFIGGMVQFAMFYLSGRLTFITPKKRLLLGTVVIFVAIVLNYLATQIWMVIAGTCLLFGSYSIILPAARQIVIENIDYRFQTSANGLIDSCYSFLAGAIALFFAGMIAEATSVKFMILVTLGISVIPLTITAYLAATDKKETH